ncbi:MAG: TetR/AcrR family transcriptional regulator [Acidimicrobiia bacterium]
MTTESDTSISLRSRQREFTRRLIVEALAEVIVEKGIHDFSMEEVADRAGVSIRTLYRYFPNRDDLLSGLDEQLQILFTETVGGLDAYDRGLDLIPEMFEVFERDAVLVKAFVIYTLATGNQLGTRGERGRRIHDIVDEALPDASPDTRRSTFALVRLLWSSTSWMVLTTELGLSSTEAGETVQLAIEALFRAANRGEMTPGHATVQGKKTKKSEKGM